MIWSSLLAWSLVLAKAGDTSLPSAPHPLPADASAFYYTFRSREAGGGIGEVIVDSGGRILSHRPVLQDSRFKRAWKVAVSRDGRFVGATAEQSNLNNLALYDRTTGQTTLRSVPRETDAIEPWSVGFVIGASEGVIYFLNPLDPRAPVRRYNLRQNTYPPARKPEYIAIHGDEAWITIQKDSRTQRTKGSRVILFDLANWRLRHDLLMARDRPDLELNSLRERGPSPEIVVISPASNTLLLSMDRYGGVLLADLDAARQGAWVRRSVHSTAPDGRFGTAFPDRWCHFTHRGRDFVLIMNSGPQGGAALVDLAARQIIQHIEVPPGLESPSWLPRHALLVAGAPGKLKRTLLGSLTEDRAPQNGLFLFHVRNTADAIRLEPRHLDLPLVIERTAPLSPNSHLLFAQARNEVLVIDSISGTILSRSLAPGRIYRITSLH